MCSACTKGVWFCTNCDHYFCEACCDAHNEHRIFREHVLIEVPQPAVFCEKHYKDYTLFCCKCNIILCFTCFASGECRGHDIQELHKVVPEKEKHLQNVRQEMVRLMEKFDAIALSKHAANLRMKQLLKQCDIVRKHYENIIYKIKVQEFEVLCSLQQAIADLQEYQEMYECKDEAKKMSESISRALKLGDLDIVSTSLTIGDKDLNVLINTMDTILDSQALNMSMRFAAKMPVDLSMGEVVEAAADDVSEDKEDVQVTQRHYMSLMVHNNCSLQ